MNRGTVSEWKPEDGWGVIVGPSTPNGCWFHIHDVNAADAAALMTVGLEVLYSFESGWQDGYDSRALAVVIPEQPSKLLSQHTRTSAYRSKLTVTFDSKPEEIK